jgi:hypothetical protein
LTWIQLYLLVESGLYKHDVHVYKKVSYPKQRSLLVSHVFVLPGLLTQVFTRSGNSLPDFLPGFLPKIVPDSLPESLPRTLPESPPGTFPESPPERVTQSFTRVLPRHVPDRVNPVLPEHLPGRVKSYPITYPTLSKAYPAR